MSDEAEMVTISVPVNIAQSYARTPGTISTSDSYNHMHRACKAALDARKSKYDRWRDEMDFPWRVNDEQYQVESQDGCEIITCNQLRLASSAQKLLDRVVDRISMAIAAGHEPHLLDVSAIEAALPPEVVEEVLGSNK